MGQAVVRLLAATQAGRAGRRCPAFLFSGGGACSQHSAVIHDSCCGRRRGHVAIRTGCHRRGAAVPSLVSHCLCPASLQVWSSSRAAGGSAGQAAPQVAAGLGRQPKRRCSARADRRACAAAPPAAAGTGAAAGAAATQAAAVSRAAGGRRERCAGYLGWAAARLCGAPAAARAGAGAAAAAQGASIWAACGVIGVPHRSSSSSSKSCRWSGSSSRKFSQ